MGKSRAEIQKEYRLRKIAKEGQTYREHETARVMKYYTKAQNLSAKHLKKRNYDSMMRNRLSRLKKREQRMIAEEPREETSGYGTLEDNGNLDDDVDQPEAGHAQRLIVKLPGMKTPNRAKGPKVARKRALARAGKEIRKLEDSVDKLKRQVKSKSTQLRRLRLKFEKQKENRNATENVMLTPRRQTNREVRSLLLTPKRRSLVRRKLLLCNAMLSQLGNKRADLPTKRRQIFHQVVAGNTIRKYRLISGMAKLTGLSRKSMAKIQEKKDNAYKIRQEVRSGVAKKYAPLVASFLQREENCRTQPGKKDAVKVGSGEKVQTVVLTVYLSNLHAKFLSEYPDVKLSFPSFCRMRPAHVLPCSFIARTSCLCTQHQNMAHKILAIRKVGVVELNRNPEILIPIIEKNELNCFLDMISADVENIQYKEWKRVKDDDGKFKTQLTGQSAPLPEFKAMFEKECIAFVDHVERLRAQYKNIRHMKESLDENEVLVHMDFAENYKCQPMDAVQSSYWSQLSVTLHPFIVYFKEKSGNDGEYCLKHQSFVIVSDEMSHNAGTVSAFIDVIVAEIRKLVPTASRVNYWTDSPTSQYRNKHIFDLLSKHGTKFGLQARWHYFEAGHGKGACDGIGGCSKRLADAAVRQGNASIQNAQEYFQWASSLSTGSIKYIFVPKRQCDEKQAEMSSGDLRPIHNTMKLHAVAWDLKMNCFKTRELSCVCAICTTGHFCNGWKSVSKDTGREITQPTLVIQNSKFAKNNYVAAVYDTQWYIGKIITVSEEPDGNEYEITFMEWAKANLRWPVRQDCIYVQEDMIICHVSEPQPLGKSGRFFKLNLADREMIEQMFESSI